MGFCSEDKSGAETPPLFFDNCIETLSSIVSLRRWRHFRSQVNWRGVSFVSRKDLIHGELCLVFSVLSWSCKKSISPCRDSSRRHAWAKSTSHPQLRHLMSIFLSSFSLLYWGCKWTKCVVNLPSLMRFWTFSSTLQALFYCKLKKAFGGAGRIWTCDLTAVLCALPLSYSPNTCRLFSIFHASSTRMQIQ